MSLTVARDDTWIVYDGDCPFCSSYVRYLRLQESIGKVRLVNAREGGPEVDAVFSSGLDLNEGMALHYRGLLYHGEKCLNMLALMSTRSDWFNRVNGMLFASRTVARVAYPILRAGRNLTLRILGRAPIGRRPPRNVRSGSDAGPHVRD